MREEDKSFVETAITTENVKEELKKIYDSIPDMQQRRREFYEKMKNEYINFDKEQKPQTK